MGGVDQKIKNLHGAAQTNGLLNFDQVNQLPSLEAKRDQMLLRCQEIYKLAASRVRQSGKGATFPDPDAHGMVKCVELSANLMGLIASATKRAQAGESEENQRAADIQQIATLLRSVGYTVEPPKAA